MEYAFYAPKENILYDIGKNNIGDVVDYLTLKHYEHLIIPDRYCDLFNDWEEEKEIQIEVDDKSFGFKGLVILRIPVDVKKIDTFEDEEFILEFNESR